MGIVKRDSFWITLIAFAGVAIGYANKILLFPNFLSEEQVGLTTILSSLALLYAQFSALGIPYGILRFFPFFKTPDKRHNGLFFWSALGVSIGFLLFTALFLIFREPVINYFAAKSPLLSHYYLLLIPLGLTTLFYNLYNTWLQALQKTIVSSFSYDVLLRLLITVEISAFALGWLTFEQFILIYVAIHFVPTLILLLYALYLGHSYPLPVRGRVKDRLLRMVGTYGLWQLLSGTSLYLIPVIDQTMLAGMKGLTQGAVFAIMIYVVSVLIIPYRSILKVTTPMVTQLWKERNMESMQRLYRNVSQVNLIIGILFFGVIWVNLDNLFSLMPPAYAAGRYVFLFVGIARLFDMYTGLNSVILATSKKFRYDLWFTLALAGMTILTNALLIPPFGINGAALATMFTVILFNGVRLLFVWRLFGIQPFAWRDLIVVGIGAVAIGASYLLPYMGHFIPDVLLRSAMVTALFGVAVYGLHLSEEINRSIDTLWLGITSRLKR